MRHKVDLCVPSESAGADATCGALPVAWAADTIPETVQLINEPSYESTLGSQNSKTFIPKSMANAAGEIPR